ncbi:MAG: UDP-4-amino-4,6-dideoxy-N-acetyl-beta-L-altrosamine transaminase [Alphaproteobacteria bacterium]|nr:UDP-4-amino-4,6-dideoxy-N-acetyl-beta-L-altrosamine transaminase [Alphaproteobacteria bacterium]
MNFLPYGRQLIEDDDIAAVVDALRSDHLTTGPRVGEFERALANATGASRAIACSNGTAALHLAVRALNLGPGTTTIVPAVTFLATANAVCLNGGSVVFADVDPDTGLMRPDDLAEALTRCEAQAVINVHLAGQVGDLVNIHKVAREAGLRIIEDACHAVGTSYTVGNHTHRVGDNKFADLTCFSFHPVKTIAMGEGGAVTANDQRLADIVYRDRTHGMSRDPDEFVQPGEAYDRTRNANPWYYEMDAPGLNYRIPDVLCALGTSQLKKLDKFAARRRELVAIYDNELARLAPHIKPLARTPNNTPAWHLYVSLIDFETIGIDRAVLMRRLQLKGIGTQVHYLPLYRQPFYREMEPELTLAGADEYYRRTLSLPLFPSMSDSDPARVVDALQQALTP